MHFKEFYSCPNCGRAIVREKRKYFTCPACERALCPEEDLPAFDDNYCGNCGTELASAKKEALGLVSKENEKNSVESEPKKHERILEYYGISDADLIRTGGSFWISSNCDREKSLMLRLIPSFSEMLKGGKVCIIIHYDADYDYWISRLDESYTQQVSPERQE